MEEKLILACVELDTAYGKIKKVARGFLIPIEDEEMIKLYLKRAFIKLENDVLKEFETMKKFNKQEHILQKISECEVEE